MSSSICWRVNSYLRPWILSISQHELYLVLFWLFHCQDVCKVQRHPWLIQQIHFSSEPQRLPSLAITSKRFDFIRRKSVRSRRVTRLLWETALDGDQRFDVSCVKVFLCFKAKWGRVPVERSLISSPQTRNNDANIEPRVDSTIVFKMNYSPGWRWITVCVCVCAGRYCH